MIFFLKLIIFKIVRKNLVYTKEEISKKVEIEDMGGYTNNINK